jgi:phosphatidylglycerophosphate synthase
MSPAGPQTPDDSLRASVRRAGTVGVLVVTGAALAARSWLELGPPYPWKAAAAFAAAMAVAASVVAEHHPHRQFGSANLVTMVRAMLVALLASLIGEPATPEVAMAAATGAAVATSLDGVDGWLARRGRTASVFGARFDVETDAALVLALSLLVWQHGKAGAWVLAGGLMRYAFVAAGWWLDWMARPLRPTYRAKTITIFHLTALIVALAPIVPSRISTVAVATTLALLAWSFAVDVRRLWREE